MTCDDNRVALVTEASQGVGFQVAKEITGASNASLDDVRAESVEGGSREVVRVALLGPDRYTTRVGTVTHAGLRGREVILR